MRLSLFVFALITCLGGCAAQYVPIPFQSPQQIVDSLAIGDSVRIVMIDGTEVTMNVDDIGSDFVVGDSERVSIDEIAAISILQKSTLDAGEVSRVIWACALIGYLFVQAL
jgi:hypothetical protein